MKKLLLLLVTFVFGQVYSQDIIGGHIRTKWVSSFSYSISITLFTDASKNIIRPTIPVSFGDATSGTFTLAGTSNSGGINVKTYSGIHTYPGGGQYLANYLDTFRVAGIKNMLSSQTQQFYIESLININTFIGANTSPTVASYPLSYSVAINQPIYYNAGFSDTDGDSLSYSLINCSGNGYYIPINAVVNYSTSTFSFSKDTVGKYAFALKIIEWRKNTSNIYNTIATSQMDFVVDITNTIGLNEFADKKINLFVYPNPVTNELNIILDDAIKENYSIEIINGLGQTVLKTNYNDKINVTALRKGFYFLKLSDKSIFSDSFKFIKE
jgi:hypothetical protein